MDMRFNGTRIGFRLIPEEYRQLVVKFYQNDGTVDAVIKRTVCFIALNPCKMCFIEIEFDFIHFSFGVTVPYVANIFRYQIEQARESGTGKSICVGRTLPSKPSINPQLSILSCTLFFSSVNNRHISDLSWAAAYE